MVGFVSAQTEDCCDADCIDGTAYYDVAYNSNEPNKVKFEDAKDTVGSEFSLGEDGQFETDIFTIIVDEDYSDLSVYTKAATVVGEVDFTLDEVCQPYETENGFKITILSITYDEQTGYYTYEIAVTAVCPPHALSNIVFDFGYGATVISGGGDGFVTGSAIIDPTGGTIEVPRQCGFGDDSCEINPCEPTTTSSTSTSSTSSSTTSTTVPTTTTTIDCSQNCENPACAGYPGCPEVVPEFSTIGIIAAIGAVGIYLLKRKK